MSVTGEWLEYLLSFAGSALLCAVLTPLAMSIAVRSGSLDHPGGHKSHGSPIPYLGGVAMVIAFGTAVTVVSLTAPPESGLGELIVVLSVATLLGLVGLADDLWELLPFWRLAMEVGAAVTLWSIGSGVTVANLRVVDLGLTLLWVVGITNSFNLLDNMDGLAAGLGTIISLTFFVVASSNGQFLVAGLSIALAGCAAGFLPHNFHPAKIYMGDGGALFVGFLIAYLGIKLRITGSIVEKPTLAALVPVVACSLAILDTSLVTVSRIASGRSPFRGGQDHVSHRLVKAGFSVRAAVSAIYFVALVIGVLTLVISRVDAGSAWILVGLVGLTLTVGGVLLLRVPVYSE